MGARVGLPLEVCPGTSFQERGLTSLGRGVGLNLRDCKSWAPYSKAAWAPALHWALGAKLEA